jgi:AcrR family transcriptional regulator
MTGPDATPSARKSDLLEAAYGYVLTHGLVGVSLRPLAAAIGSSPRVLLYLFGSKDGLVRSLLARARADELALLASISKDAGLAGTARQLWAWLSVAGHRPLLTLWVEGYAHSLLEPDGAWAGFADGTVQDWLDLLARAQPPGERDTPAGLARRTLTLAVLRGALLDLLATGDDQRTTAAVENHLTTVHPNSS